MNKSINPVQLLPVLFGFFIMGFVDVVSISTSYVKADFSLNDKLANLLPMMVFLWFAVFSLPVGMFMGRIGRRRTVLLSTLITTVAMLIPLVAYSFPFVLLAFALLGIGNTILQVSLNPLVTNVVPDRRITGMLTATPKYLLERCHMPLEKGGLGCSLYYAARTAGTFIGSILLVRMSSRKFLTATLPVAIVAFVFLMLTGQAWAIMSCLAIVGLMCANVFAIVFSNAIKTDPSKTNEISALMIMGVAGGALLPPLMGVISDVSSQLISLLIPLAALAYILVSAYYVIRN